MWENGRNVAFCEGAKIKEEQKVARKGDMLAFLGLQWT